MASTSYIIILLLLAPLLCYLCGKLIAVAFYKTRLHYLKAATDHLEKTFSEKEID